jgi:hypothetical protein
VKIPAQAKLERGTLSVRDGVGWATRLSLELC